jgi:three-Cys-motif partner protein
MMAAPSKTVWDMEPHTRAKHEILGRYLRAWQAILTQGGFQDLVYIDGFAGPGRYSGGEDGSPVIALRNALALYQHRQNIPRLIFLFVEKDPERARVLKEIVESFERPERIRVRVAEGQTFEEAFSEFVGFYESRNRKLPPTFAFIDPFGWTGASFSIVKKIMSYPSCEVLVNFMYEEINRFVSPPQEKKTAQPLFEMTASTKSKRQVWEQLESSFDSFFGTPEWRKAQEIKLPRERNRFLHDLYARQLREAAGVKYVRSFQMKNDRDVTDYYLFHSTNSLTGLQKMKEAMWRVDESGEFTFSDATDHNQFVMFERKPQFEVLRKQILNEFSGKETTVAVVEEFVVANTAFRETHYKALLKDMEQANPPLLTVKTPPAGRRRGTFGSPDMAIKFA